MGRKLEAVEDRLRLATQVLMVLNQSGGKVDAIREILLRIKVSGGFEAVGIRLREGEDFPYYETNGFEAEFVERERYLCARTPDGKPIRDPQGAVRLECMCGMVIEEKVDPALPIFTKRGSFWTNSTSELLPTLARLQGQTCIRGRCHTAGYESLALLPLRSGDTVIGLLQINDRRRGCFTLELIEFLEEIAASVGIALARKQAEDATRLSEEHFRRTFDQSPIGAAIVTLDYRFQRVNDALCRITGYARDELLARGFPDITHPDDLAADMVFVKHLLNGEIDQYQADKRYIRKDGAAIWIRLSARMMRDAEGRPLYYLPMMEDIDQRKQAEEVLKRYQLLAENGRDIILFVRHHDGRIVEANAAAVATYGYTRDELLSMRINDLRDPQTHPATTAQMAEACASGIVFETIHRCKDGRQVPVEVSSRGAQIGGEQILLSIIRDVSERKRAEGMSRRQQAELAHLARVTAVGEMASHLAHELNQPLGAMLNYSGVCLDVIRSSSARTELVVEALEEIRKETIRAGEIVRRVRAFIRKQEAQRQAADIGVVIREAIDLMAFEVRRAGISLVIELADALPPVVIDPVQIQQVLVNLIQNAIDAEADCRTDERKLTIQAAPVERRAVRVSIIDTGCGIAPESRAKVFESFFTTKPNGLGMGLAISRSIIESHGGQLEAIANADRGMTFEFTLPVGY